MAYTIPQIIQWAKISQPLARVGEAKKKSKGNQNSDVNLDIKLYDTRRDVEYEYDQDPTSENLFTMGNYLLSLCGVYLFQAQAATGSGGSISPITPSIVPDPYDFDVDGSSFIATGETSKTLPSSWIGFNIILVRAHITQSVIDNTVDTCYSWDRGTASLILINGAAELGENIQIFPLS